MSKILCLIVLCFIAASCKTDYKDFIKTKVVPATATGIAKGLECAKPDVIEADIHKVLKKVKIETANQTVIDACKSAVSVAMPLLIQNGIPKTWECKGTMATKGLIAIGEAACTAAGSAI